jgi:hypothetical protein
MHALILLIGLAVVPHQAPSGPPDAGQRKPEAPKKKKKDHKGDSKDEEFRAFDVR